MVVKNELQFLGKGLYGIAEASRLLRRPSAQVRRWANGYTYARAFDRAQRPPVLLTSRDSKEALTFHELIELFFVREYTSAGISLPHIRETATGLRSEYGVHPFAAKRLLKDGKRLVAISEAGLIAPSTCQLVADFASDFVEEIEFADDFARIWRPKEGENLVVIDPMRAMGEPILEVSGTPTRTIFQTYRREQDLDRVADYYELPFPSVKQAVEFELRFANAA